MYVVVVVGEKGQSVVVGNECTTEAASPSQRLVARSRGGRRPYACNECSRRERGGVRAGNAVPEARKKNNECTKS